jgi:hypothetical protein
MCCLFLLKCSWIQYKTERINGFWSLPNSRKVLRARQLNRLVKQGNEHPNRLRFFLDEIGAEMKRVLGDISIRKLKQKKLQSRMSRGSAPVNTLFTESGKAEVPTVRDPPFIFIGWDGPCLRYLFPGTIDSMLTSP